MSFLLSWKTVLAGALILLAWIAVALRRGASLRQIGLGVGLGLAVGVPMTLFVFAIAALPPR
jgi:hypothetical protein